MRLVIFSFLFWSQLLWAQLPIPSGAVFRGPELVGGGTCHVVIVSMSADYMEILFSVMAKNSDDVIHLEVLTLERLLPHPLVQADYERREETSSIVDSNNRFSITSRRTRVKWQPEAKGNYLRLSLEKTLQFHFASTPGLIAPSINDLYLTSTPLFDCPNLEPTLSR